MSEVVCPSCGHWWPGGTAFCGTCANIIPTQSVTPDPRVVAVVPADSPPAAPLSILVPPLAPGPSTGIDGHSSNTRGSNPEHPEVIVLSASREYLHPRAAKKDQRVPRKLTVALVGAMAVCALGASSLGIYAVASDGNRWHSASVPSPSASALGSTVPAWWKPAPVWRIKGTALAMTGDGHYVAVSVPSGVQIRAADTGRLADTIKEPGLRVVAITSDGEHGFLAWSTVDVRVWTPKGGASAAIALNGNQRVDVKGDGSPLVTAGSNEIAWAVTAAGLVAYSSPSNGAVPVAVVNGGVAWASARQAILVAGPDGTMSATIPIAAPDGTATISRWLGVAGGQMLVVWTDGVRQILTGTSITGAAGLAATQLDRSDATARLVPSGDAKTAMLGALVLHLDNEVAPTTASGCVATAAGVGLFLGTANGETVLIRPNGAKITLPNSLTPIGVTRAGELLASTANGVELFPAK